MKARVGSDTDFLIYPFLSFVDLLQTCLRHPMSANVETVPAHNILDVAVPWCRYYRVLWSCTHLSSWNVF